MDLVLARTSPSLWRGEEAEHQLSRLHMRVLGRWLGRDVAAAASAPSPWHGLALRDAVAGIVASFVTLSYCLSFSALVFAGDLASGLPMALWGFMLATAVVTLLSAVKTTLSPFLAGPRNPVVAVMAVLATTVSAAALDRGVPPADVARYVLVALSIASMLTGAICWALGAFRLGQAVRFVPYPVIGGFLAASGLLLLTGGIKVGTGATFDADGLAALLAGEPALRLALTLAFGVVLARLRHLRGGARLLPAVIVLAVVTVELVLWMAKGGSSPGWHLAMTGGARGWSPLASLAGIDWSILASASVEIASIAGVSTAALLLDVSSLEVQRRAQADMDTEFRVNGAANLAVVAVGGFSVGLALNPTRLVDALGGRGRAASLAGGAFIGLLLASGIDLASLVPRPVLGGLLLFLGAGILSEALKVPGRRSRPEFALTLLIMGAIVGLGYLTGILLGMIGASVLFAARYSRIDVIRRHVTRASLSAPVERRPEVARLLAEQGSRIHIVWLSGYLFFGSSNGLYESIRQATASRGLFGRRWVVLDCSAVTGIDASAVLSFQKLANWAAVSDVSLVFAAASPALVAELAAAGLFEGGTPARHFLTRNEALEWAEDQLVHATGAAGETRADMDFESWLARELGSENARGLIGRYLERRDLEGGEIVCALGAPADTIELVASGSVAVVVPGLGDRPVRVRRMRDGTVVGEMGFFRHSPRAASVIAEEPAVVYVLTRKAYERLLSTEPALCAAVLQFVVRALSDRLESANREIGALL
ncbi:MAG: SulP family inorganic anion transporter [Hyphomicrobiaceae bacterium]